MGLPSLKFKAAELYLKDRSMKEAKITPDEDSASKSNFAYKQEEHP
jgi:hypothetical protein